MKNAPLHIDRKTFGISNILHSLVFVGGGACWSFGSRRSSPLRREDRNEMREHLRRYVNLSRRRHHMDLVCHFNSADTTTCRAMVSCCRCTLNGCFPSFQKRHDLRFDNNTIAGTTLGGERRKVSGITKSQGRLHLWQWQSELINPWSSLKNPRQKNGLSSSGWTHNYQVMIWTSSSSSQVDLF